MKNRLINFLAIALIALSIASCGPKISDEFKGKISEFENQWTSASTQRASLIETVQREIESNSMMHGTMVAKFDSLKASDPKQKKLNNELLTDLEGKMNNCKVHGENYNEIFNLLNNDGTNWDATTAAFAALKSKIGKDEVEQAEAEKELELHQQALANGLSELEQLNAKFESIKASCAETCSAFDQTIKDLK